jgi:hypothetical protein
MESSGRFTTRATGVLSQRALATIAAESVDKRAVMRHMLQALSVSRMTGNRYMWKHAMQGIPQSSGRCFQAGVMQPTDDEG